jgi:hypothetical protein
MHIEPEPGMNIKAIWPHVGNFPEAVTGDPLGAWKHA